MNLKKLDINKFILHNTDKIPPLEILNQNKFIIVPFYLVKIWLSFLFESFFINGNNNLVTLQNEKCKTYFSVILTCKLFYQLSIGLFNYNTYIRKISETDSSTYVSLLLNQKKFDPSFNNNLFIINASRNGHVKIVKILLTDKRVDPFNYDNIAIRFAILKGHVEVVKLLLTDKRVNPSIPCNFPIILATSHEQNEIAQLLLNNDKVKKFVVENLLYWWKSKGGKFKELVNDLSKQIN